MLKLSVIVPSYNESLELKKAGIEAIDNFLKKQSFEFEVLIVDDESTNNTLEGVKQSIKGRKGFKVMENKHGGKAITVMTGLIESKGEIALFTDMDQATPIDQLTKILPLFNQGNDIVIGVRQSREGAPLERKVMSWGFATLRNIILGLPLSDTQCGFKAFSRESVDQIFPPMLNKWQNMRKKGAAVNAGFDVETLFIAKKKGFKIGEAKVQWHHVQNEKQVQIVQDSIEAIKDMLRIRLNDIQGRYN